MNIDTNPLPNSRGADTWLPLSEVAPNTPYSSEYLSLLARKRKIASKKIGNVWYTTPRILEEYMKKQMLREQVQNGSISSLPVQVSESAPANSNTVQENVPAHAPTTDVSAVRINANEYPQLKRIRSYHADLKEYAERTGLEISEVQSRKEPEEKKNLFLKQEKMDAVVFTPAERAKGHTEVKFGKHLAQAEKKQEDKPEVVSGQVGRPVGAVVPIRTDDDSLLESIEHAFEKIIEKRLHPDYVERTGGIKEGKHFDGVKRKSPVRQAFAGKAVALSTLVLFIALAVMPAPLVFGFLDRSMDFMKNAFNDANTVMGFRPGTHANEILLLDKEGNVSIRGHIESDGQLRSYASDGVAPIVVDSMTQVDNLNVQYLSGLEAREFTLSFVTANGNVTTEDVTLGGSVAVGETLQVRGATKLLSTLEIGGELTVFGDTVLNRMLTVHGSAELKDNLNVGKNITVRGGIEAGSSIVAKGASFAYANVSGDLHASGRVELGNSEEAFVLDAENITVDEEGNLTLGGSINGGNLTVTTIIATNASTTNATSTSLFSSTADFTTLTFGNATGTSATTTNFFSNTGVFGSMNVSGDTVLEGALTVGGETVTLGQLLSTRIPTLPHIFTTWPDGVSNASDATIYINPSSAAPDTNIFAAAVNDQVKFLVDAEGDVYANNLVLTGSVSQGETTIAGNLTVQDNTFLGDAASDITTFSGALRLGNLTTAQRDGLTASAGYALFNTSLSKMQVYNGAEWKNVGNPEIGGEVTDGTSGSVLFVDSSGNLAQDNANFSWDDALDRLTATNALFTSATSTNLFSTTASSTNLYSASARLGALTAGDITPIADNAYSLGTPALRWESVHVGPGSLVVHNDATDTLKATLDFSGSTARLITDSATPLQLTTGANVGLNINTAGNIGIGTTTPGLPLHVVRNPGGTGVAKFEKLGTSADPAVLIVSGDNSSTRAALQVQGNAGAIESLFVASNGTVGIGTAGPSNLLEVSKSNSGAVQELVKLTNNPGSNVVGTGAKLRFDSFSPMAAIESAVDVWQVGVDYQASLRFYTTPSSGIATERVRITGNGNVGIGTTDPGAKLDVWDGNFYLSDTDVAHGMTAQGPTTMYAKLAPLSSTAGGLNFGGISDTDATGLQAFGLIGSTDPTDTIPAILLETGKKNTTNAQALGALETVFRLNNWGTNMMTVLGSGNVGIGGTSPQALLQVGAGTTAPGFGTASKTLYISGSGQHDLLIRDTSSNVVGGMYAETSTVGVRAASNHPLTFATNNVERMRLSTGGILTIGTTVTPSNGNTLVHLPNGKYLGGVIAAGTAAYNLIGMNALDQVSIGSEGHNTIFGGRIYINSTNYLDDSTGTYGSIQINGGGNAGYEGFNIDGRAGFVHNGDQVTGVINDVENEWLWYADHNGAFRAFYDGAERLQTTAGGVSTTGTLTSSSDMHPGANVYTDNNYGYGLVGLYSATRYQGVFAMGDAYKLSADGTTPGSLYGIAWTHQNIAGQSKSGLGHQALFMSNGITTSAVGSGIWTSGVITGASNLEIAGTTDSVSGYQISDVNRVTGGSTYTQLHRGNGTIGIYLGGSDASNYYDNTQHVFRGSGGSGSFLTINSTNATFGGHAIGGVTTLTASGGISGTTGSFSSTLTTGRISVTSGSLPAINISGFSPTDASSGIRMMNTQSSETYQMTVGIANVGYNGLSIYDVTNAATRLYIGNTGKVGIATTNPQTNSTFDVNGAIGFRMNNVGDTSALCYRDWTGGLLTIDRCSSSLRYKENVQTLEIDKEKVLTLRPVEFNWKSTGTRDVGFIAEEVAEIIPEIVEYSDGVIEGLDYRLLTPYIIAILQDHDLSIKEMDLAIEDIRASLSYSSTSTEPVAENSVFTSVVAFFADVYHLVLEDGILRIAQAFTDRITTKELCVEDVCVTRDQFLQIVHASTNTSSSSSSSTNSSTEETPDSSTSTDVATTTESTTGIDEGETATTTGETSVEEGISTTAPVVTEESIPSEEATTTEEVVTEEEVITEGTASTTPAE